MGMRSRVWLVVGLSVGLLGMSPSAWAADGDTSEAAEAPVSKEFTDHLRAAIDTETDPEMKQVMREQLGQLESGKLSLNEMRDTGPREANQTAGLRAPATSDVLGGRTSTGGLQGRTLGDSVAGGGLVGPPVETGGTGRAGEQLPSDVREQLHKVFDDVAKGGRSEGQARVEAEKILKEHGIEPQSERSGEGSRGELEHAGERRGPEALERASSQGLEHMAPEAREHLERNTSSRETTRETTRDQERMTRETSEQREAHTQERSTHEVSQREARESPQREAPQREAMEHEAPQREAMQREAPEQREVPTQERPTYEAPQHEYQQPESMPH